MGYLGIEGEHVMGTKPCSEVTLTRRRGSCMGRRRPQIATLKAMPLSHEKPTPPKAPRRPPTLCASSPTGESYTKGPTPWETTLHSKEPGVRYT